MKKNSKGPRRVAKRGKANARRKKKTANRRRPAVISIRRSSGRKEKFDIERLAQTTSRSGVPFLMARDIAKIVSKQIKAEVRGKSKKMVTANRVRKMIAGELHDRNQKTIASSYEGITPENAQNQNIAKVGPHESPVGSADTDQHNAYRADRDSVMHDRSKRLASSA
jgi:transcriptional regulator NrdR family protein